MKLRTFLASALALVTLSGTPLSAKAKEKGFKEAISEALDRMFEDKEPFAPYSLRLVLRFDDSDTQFVVSVYAPECKVIRYSLTGLGGKTLTQLLEEAPGTTDYVRRLNQITARAKVNVARSSLSCQELGRALDELNTIRISPLLGSRALLDDYSTFDFWLQTGFESVHYTLGGPVEGDPQDALVQWMIRFRTVLTAAFSEKKQ